jgi:transposase
VRRIREVFGVDQLVLIGDRGLISHKQIAELQDDQSLHWITALRTVTIRKLRGDGALQMGLFDERNLVEFTHPAYPGERLIACRNAALARLRAAKRQSLLEATARELQRVQESIQSGRLRGRANIGMRVGRVINKYKVAKHFRVRIAERSFAFEVATDRVEAEAELDGIYVVRTSLPRQQMTADETVRSYKRLTNVERAFRSFKTIDLKVRPIHHRLEDRVRAHIFLCMLAYYVQWHLFEAWRPLLLADEDQRAKGSRDPVAPAERSPEALRKIAAHRLEDGSEAHSFRTLLTELSTIVRNHCRRRGAPETEPVITMTTLPNPTQRRALDLAAGIHV